MRKVFPSYVFAFIVQGFLLSCALDTGAAKTETLKCRTSFISSGDVLSIKAAMESPEGFSLNGGFVYVLDPANEILQLEYDTAKTAYVGQKNSPAEGVYEIVFRSARYPSQSIKTEFHPITEKPEITDTADASGNSAFLGQSLKASEDIQVTWNPALGSTVYSVRIYQNLGVVYAGSTTDNFITIPENSIKTAGQVMVQIQGQDIRGDPLFLASEVYSAAASDSTNLYFKVTIP